MTIVLTGSTESPCWVGELIFTDIGAKMVSVALAYDFFNDGNTVFKYLQQTYGKFFKISYRLLFLPE